MIGPAIHAELFFGLPTSVEEDVGLVEDVGGVDVARYCGFGTMVVYVVVKKDTTPPGRVVGTSVVTVVPMMKSIPGRGGVSAQRCDSVERGPYRF